MPIQAEGMSKAAAETERSRRLEEALLRHEEESETRHRQLQAAPTNTATLAALRTAPTLNPNPKHPTLKSQP